jgi:hypothetical protein
MRCILSGLILNGNRKKSLILKVEEENPERK